jgi:anti-sigma regulatory factor (Ser/Thr protein kinase)
MTGDKGDKGGFRRLASPRAQLGGDEGEASVALDVRFDSGPPAATGARAALSALEHALAPNVMEDLRLLVTELVTNSVRHAETAAVRLRVMVAGDVVRVEVTDAGRGFIPSPRAPTETREGGWGLYLVDRLADRWGVAREGITRVWFEIGRRASALGGGAPMRFAASG